LLKLNQFLAAVEEHTGRKLNDEQRSGVTHGNGPLWILAGPGSGKTEVLVLRCLKLALVDEIEPRSIILTTFTEKAARSLQERILTRKAAVENRYSSVSKVDVSAIRIGTLHSIANDVMHEFRYRPYQNTQLLDDLEQLMFIHQKTAIAAGTSGASKTPPTDDFWITFGFLLDRHSDSYPGRWKRAKAGADLFDRIVEDRVDIASMIQVPDECLKQAVALYYDYANELYEAKRVDFAHLQGHFVQFLQSPQAQLFLEGDGSPSRPGVSNVLVDEYQDTNPIQELIYFQLASRVPHNLTVVGDDEQALYRFRGGDVRCILSFEAAVRQAWNTSTAKVYLTTNYRSLAPIVDFFNDFALSTEPTRLLRQLVGKPDIVAVRAHHEAHPAVAIIQRSKVAETALDFAGLVRELKRRKTIKEYSNCALLVRSTREHRPNGALTEAGEYARALRLAEIPMYNPRSRAMLEQPEVQITLGALLEALDSTDRLNEMSSKQPYQNMLLRDWRKAFHSEPRRSQLLQYIERVQSSIRNGASNNALDMELLELFYTIINREPLRQAQDDPEQTLRLSILSDVLEAYTNVYGAILRMDTHLRGEISLPWKRSFYFSFLDLLISEGLNEFEDRGETFPVDRLPIMTFHQAKGLEFPIVFVGSIGITPEYVRWKSQSKEFALEDLLKPWRTSLGSKRLPPFDAVERATQDTIRLYYVAYSRAQDSLILLIHEPNESEGLLTLPPQIGATAARI